jgi:excisionase family DNA binding protein
VATKERPTRPERGDDLLNYEQAAEHLGPAFTARQVRRRVEDGTIKFVRLSERKRVIRRSELDAYIARCEEDFA